MNTNITFEERQLMSLYNASGTREGLIAELKEMRKNFYDSIPRKIKGLHSTPFRVV